MALTAGKISNPACVALAGKRTCKGGGEFDHINMNAWQDLAVATQRKVISFKESKIRFPRLTSDIKGRKILPVTYRETKAST